MEGISCTHPSVRDMDVDCQLEVHFNEVVNKTWNFSGRLETRKDHYLNAAVGLAAEAGEVLDLHKKIWFHSGRMTVTTEHESIKHELGDVIYYWLKLLDLHGYSIQEVLDANRNKLESRHPELGKVSERFGPGAIK